MVGSHLTGSTSCRGSSAAISLASSNTLPVTLLYTGMRGSLISMLFSTCAEDDGGACCFFMRCSCQPQQHYCRAAAASCVAGAEHAMADSSYLAIAAHQSLTQTLKLPHHQQILAHLLQRLASGLHERGVESAAHCQRHGLDGAGGHGCLLGLLQSILVPCGGLRQVVARIGLGV